MRVLAVAQVLHLLVVEAQTVGKDVVGLGNRVAAVLRLDLREVAGDRRLVAGGVAERLLREVEAGGGGGPPPPGGRVHQPRGVPGGPPPPPPPAGLCRGAPPAAPPPRPGFPPPPPPGG